MGNGAAGFATTRTLTIDPNWQDEDLIGAVLHWSNTSALTIPAGWSLVQPATTQPGLQTHAHLVHVLSQAEIDAATTWNFTIATNARFVGIGYACSGVDISLGAPGAIDASVAQLQAAISVTYAVPAVTTNTANPLIIATWGARWIGANGANPIAVPGTHTDIAESATAAAIGPGIGIQVSVHLAALSINPPTAGVFGPYNATALIAARAIGGQVAYLEDLTNILFGSFNTIDASGNEPFGHTSGVGYISGREPFGV